MRLGNKSLIFLGCFCLNLPVSNVDDNEGDFAIDYGSISTSKSTQYYNTFQKCC